MDFPTKISPARKVAYLFLDACLPFFFTPLNKIKQALLRPINKRYIQLSLTYNCQCRCLHCGMSWYGQKGKKLKPDEVFGIINKMVGLNFGQIDFFGGEPLLDDNIYSYIKHASRKGIFSHLNTNGLLLSRKNVRLLKKSGLNAVSISLDNSDPQKHDANRQIKGAFEAALSGARLCMRSNIRTIMSLYATEESILNGEAQKLIKIARKEGFFRVRFLMSFKSGKKFNEESQIANPEVRIKLQEILKDKDFIKSHGIINCFVPKKGNLAISPFGDVQPCSMVPISFGNIREENLSRIIKKMHDHPIYKINEEGCIMNSKFMKELLFSKMNFPLEELPLPIERLASCPKTG